MRLIIAAAAVAVLGLSACNREEPAEPAMDAASADAGAMSADTASGGASSSMSGSSSGTAAPAAEAPAMEPAPADMAPPVTDATRANAKEKAEQTNLHPAG